METFFTEILRSPEAEEEEEQAGEEEDERVQGELERAGRVIKIFGDISAAAGGLSCS